MRAVALALVLISIPAYAERVCERGPLRPQVIAGTDGQIAGSGGVIVASGDKLPDWRFRVLNKVVRPRVVTLAPGLAIYHPPPLAGTDVVLENLEQSVIRRARRALTIDPGPEPPKLVGIESRDAEGHTSVVAELEQVRGDVVVVIVSVVERDRTVPITWVSTRGASGPKLLVWHTPYGCEQTVEATRQPRVGERVVLSFVDEVGRVSEPSKPVTVTRAKAPK
ncbi:MAG: hypothetical protein IPQ07_32440 [Myxococcales bacterium]|nr:hypothetical protein [Myxococcales bacterium]